MSTEYFEYSFAHLQQRTTECVLLRSTLARSFAAGNKAATADICIENCKTIGFPYPCNSHKLVSRHRKFKN